MSNLIVSDLISAADRRKWAGFMGAMYNLLLSLQDFKLILHRWAIGCITGPLIGDGLANDKDFRWVFWINLPFCFVAFLILPFFADLKPAPPEPVVPKLMNVDWLGFFLLGGSLVSMLLGLTWVRPLSLNAYPLAALAAFLRGTSLRS